MSASRSPHDRKHRFELKAESRLASIPLIVDFVGDVMLELGLDRQQVPRVQLAVDEAATNVIKHAYGGGRGEITVICELAGDDFSVIIRDKGKPFDPNSVPPPDLESDLDHRRVGGLGIHLMKKIMDSVSYRFDPEAGNELTMTKKIARTGGKH